MANPRVTLGPLNAIEDALVTRVAEARAEDALCPVTVLVGSTLLKRYLPRMLAQRGVGHINVRFVLPDELARQLGAGALRPVATPMQERLLVRLTAAHAGGHFERIAGGEGFAAELRRLLRDLERGGFSPASFRATATAGGLSGGKLTGLAGLFEEFGRRRDEAGFASIVDAYEAATTAAFEGPLLVYGVWNLPPVQRALVAKIAEAADCDVFLPASGGDADEAHEDFRVWLTELGFVSVAVTEDAGPDATAGVELVSAADTVREVWEAARTCLRWAEEGIAFHEMAVVYRNADPYQHLIGEIFREASLNDHTYIHQGRPLAAHPRGQRLLALLELIADEKFTRQRVMEFLTETRLPRATRERYERVRPAEWDGFTREAGVVEGIEQWTTRLTNLAEEKRERARDERFAWLAEHAERVGSLLTFVTDLHARLAEKPGVAAWATHIAYVRSLAETYADDLEPLLVALDDLKALEPILPEVSITEFLWAVRDDLERRDVSDVLGEPKREFGRRGIAVLDASSLRHLRFRAVYVLGVAERAWPLPKRPDPLLLEHERSAINGAAGGAALALRLTPDEEALTFELAVAAARERLVVSYARAEASGSGRHLPSHFFRMLAERGEGRELNVADVDAAGCVRRLPAGQLAPGDAGSSVTAAEYDRALIRSAIYDGAAGVVAALAAFDGGDAVRTGGAIERAVEARRARWGRELTAYDGVMIGSDAIARAAAGGFARTSAVSPSRLETYAECPFRFFLKYVLRVDPLEEPEAIERIDALERGSLIHDVLERFLQRVGCDDLPRAERREDHVRLLLEIAEEAGNERVERGVTGRPLIWELDRRRINDDLVRWYDEEVKEAMYDEVQPRAFEAAFGVDDALRLPIEEREMLLQGRIDRLDYDEGRTRFRVIDYKTGNSRGAKPFDKGKALQLPIYLLAAAQMLGVGLEHGRAEYYYCTSKGGFKRKGISGEELIAREGDFRQVMVTIADGVDGGFFAAHPGKGAINCMWCDYKTLCDSRIGRIAELKAGDQRATAFVALQEIK